MRQAKIQRQTGETDITLAINLDGKGRASLKTGVPFLEHMLNLFAVHGLFDLEIDAKGDLEIDAHHTTEDIGISLGQALKEALGEKRGIHRYGQAAVPMDDALAEVFVDLSGRPFFCYQGPILTGKVGTFDLELIKEFLRAMANETKMNLHVCLRYGENKHHCAEAIFKALGRALRQAVSLDPRRTHNVPSSKGVL